MDPLKDAWSFATSDEEIIRSELNKIAASISIPTVIPRQKTFLPDQYQVSVSQAYASNTSALQYASFNKALLDELWPDESPSRFECSDKGETMLEKLIRLYSAYMLQDVRSPIPHLAGPPGVGKSAVVQQLADLLGVTLHSINVSRISPLELEGVQMPVGSIDNGDYRLKLLHNTIWTQLKEGDIVLLDEFMRGFPEVYNGLLDIMTSRQVAGFTLPKVFFIGASNSVAAYDRALEDRLLHMPVRDIRTSKPARMEAMQRFISELGLIPRLIKSQELVDMFVTEIHPMYEVLDQFNHKAAVGATSMKGQSMRKLIGQAQLREFQSVPLKEVIAMNNQFATADSKWQYIFLLDGNSVPAGYEMAAAKLRVNPKLTPLQKLNLEMNIQLMDIAKAHREDKAAQAETGDEEDDPIFN